MCLYKRNERNYLLITTLPLMKKLLLALAIGTASLVSFSSCTKEYNTTVLAGKSYYFPISSADWTKTAAKQYTTTINIADLDDLYFEDGHVDVSIQFEDEKGTFYNVPTEGLRGHGYNAAYSVGKVYLDAYYLSTTGDKAPDPMRVKIVLTDADPGN